MVYIIRTERALKRFIKSTGYHISVMDRQKLKDVFFLPTAFRLQEQEQSEECFPTIRQNSWLVYSIKDPTTSLTSEKELRKYYSEQYPGITIKVYDNSILDLE